MFPSNYLWGKSCGLKLCGFVKDDAEQWVAAQMWPPLCPPRHLPLGLRSAFKRTAYESVAAKKESRALLRRRQ
jgi:hypothetical protein